MERKQFKRDEIRLLSRAVQCTIAIMNQDGARECRRLAAKFRPLAVKIDSMLNQ